MISRYVSASVVAVAAMAAAATGNFIEDHSVSIRTVFSVGGIVLPAVWWISRKFAKIEERFDIVELKLSNLPCQPKQTCPTEKSK